MDRSGSAMNGSGLRSADRDRLPSGITDRLQWNPRNKTTRMKNGTRIRGITMNPTERIDQLIAGITDWRGKTFARIRKSILAADPEIIEEWKWMGSPVWSRDRIIAVSNAHKDKVKLTLPHGARHPDPDRIFNAGLEGNARRAIACFEGDKINVLALNSLV